MRLQLTVAILKPDLLARPVAAEVRMLRVGPPGKMPPVSSSCSPQAARERIAESGLLVVRSRLTRWSRDEAQQFYKQHRGAAIVVSNLLGIIYNSSFGPCREILL